MPSYLCLSFQFLAPAFHGRDAGGEREWPPSPLRVFQALVAAAARRCGGGLSPAVRSALEWLEALKHRPVIVVPHWFEGAPYCLSVPNNAMDIVARAWVRGNDSNSGDANPAKHQSMKAVHPTLLTGDAIHYLWELPGMVDGEVGSHLHALSEVASSVAALGWGVDMVVGHGAVLSDESASALPGERWFPSNGAGSGGLRVPVAFTLRDLCGRHDQFLRRIGPDGTYTAPAALSMFERVEYRRATDPAARSVAAFSLLNPDASGYRAFDPARRGLTVAGMMRGATKAAAVQSGWPESKVAPFVLGHAESRDAEEHAAVGPARFAYLPLPSIEGRGAGKARVAGSVRRVMLCAFADGCEAEMIWARRRLSGQEVVDEATKQPVAVLSVIPTGDPVVRCYTEAAVTWATVTPVVLPGYDDPRHLRRRLKGPVDSVEQKQLLGRLDGRIEALLRKAIVQAGFSATLAEHAEIEWRRSGFWPGAEPADRYGVPGHLKRFPRLHVKIQWRDEWSRPVKAPGPICIGGGRFYGLGLFAAV